MEKKLILLAVEGKSDELTLGGVFSKLLSSNDIKFKVIETDITSSEEITPKYVIDKLQEKMEEFFSENSFYKSQDILKIIQIIDTDGAFIRPENVIQSMDEKTTYQDNNILAKDKDRLIRRNISKRACVAKLQKTTCLKLLLTTCLKNEIPYEIYYFSRNLEHVLHGIKDEITKKEKKRLSIQLAYEYEEDPSKFINTITDPEVVVEGDYKQTWKYIMENNNSLLRKSNINIIFGNLSN